MISKEQVEHIAQLARIELTEEEEKKFTKDISSILDYVERLNKVNVGKVEPANQTTETESVVRNDEFEKDDKQSAVRKKLITEALDRKGDYIRVPKILE